MNSLSKRQRKAVQIEKSQEQQEKDDQLYKQSYFGDDLDDEDNYSSSSEESENQNEQEKQKEKEKIKTVIKDQQKDQEALKLLEGKSNQDDTNNNEKMENTNQNTNVQKEEFNDINEQLEESLKNRFEIQEKIDIQNSLRYMNDNLRQFPYLRGVHFVKNLYECKRYDKSYIKYQDGQHYSINPPEINRIYYQAPLKIKSTTPELEKTNYQQELFITEDEKWTSDMKRTNLQVAKIYAQKMIKNCNETNFKQSYYYKVLNQMNLFGTYNILVDSEFSQVETLIQNMENRIQVLKKMNDEQIEEWNECDAQNFHPSLDQLYYNKKEKIKSTLYIREFIFNFINKQKTIKNIYSQCQDIQINKNTPNFQEQLQMVQQIEKQQSQYFKIQHPLSQNQQQTKDILVQQFSTEFLELQKSLKIKNVQPQIPQYIYEFKNQEALEFSVYLLVTYHADLLDMPKKQHYLSLLKPLFEELLGLKIFTNSQNQNMVLFPQDYEPDFYKCQTQNVKQNLSLVKQQLQNNVNEDKLNEILKMYNETNNQNFFEEQINHSQFLRQQDIKQQNFDENTFLDNKKYCPILKQENYSFGTAFQYLIFTYLQVMYKKMCTIFYVCDKINIQDLQIPQIKKQQEQNLNLKQFVKDVLKQYTELQINNYMYEEITKCFGDLKEQFIGFDLILNFFKRSIEQYNNDQVNQILNKKVVNNSLIQINHTIQSQHILQQKKKKLQRSLSKVYNNLKQNDDLQQLICRTSYDKENKLMFMHIFPFSNFEFQNNSNESDSEQSDIEQSNEDKQNNKLNNTESEEPDSEEYDYENDSQIQQNDSQKEQSQNDDDEDSSSDDEDQDDDIENQNQLQNEKDENNNDQQSKLTSNNSQSDYNEKNILQKNKDLHDIFEKNNIDRNNISEEELNDEDDDDDEEEDDNEDQDSQNEKESQNINKQQLQKRDSNYLDQLEKNINDDSDDEDDEDYDGQNEDSKDSEIQDNDNSLSQQHGDQITKKVKIN